MIITRLPGAVVEQVERDVDRRCSRMSDFDEACACTVTSHLMTS